MEGIWEDWRIERLVRNLSRPGYSRRWLLFDILKLCFALLCRDGFERDGYLLYQARHLIMVGVFEKFYQLKWGNSVNVWMPGKKTT